MRTIGALLAVVLLELVGLAAPAAAQQQIDATDITLGPAGSTCLVRTAPTAPTGGNLCDVAIQRDTGDVWTRIAGGVWSRLPRLGTANAWTQPQTIAGVEPILGLNETDAAADARAWRFDVNSGRFSLQTVNDAGSSAATLLDVTRAGLVTVATSLSSPAAAIGTLTGTGATFATLTATSSVSTPAASITTLTGTTATFSGDVNAINLGVSGTLYASRLTGTTAEVRILPTGNLVLDPGGKAVVPARNYDVNLGTLPLKFFSLNVANLVAETLVAQNVMSTIGGRVLVAPTTQLTIDVDSSPMPANWIGLCMKDNNLAVGDIVYMQTAPGGAPQFEAWTVQQAGGLSPGCGGGPDAYYYAVSGASGLYGHHWYAGDAIVNTGQAGAGYIDLYSVSGILGAGAGPTIVGNVRTGAGWNQVEPRWAIGNLNGLYGYGGSMYGSAFGSPGGAWLKIDPTNGVRIGYAGTTKVQIDGGGNAAFSGTITAASGTIGGWAIAATSLSASTAVNAGAGMVSTYGDWPIYAGSDFANRGSAPFRVDWFGQLWLAPTVNFQYPSLILDGRAQPSGVLMSIRNDKGQYVLRTGSVDLFWAGADASGSSTRFTVTSQVGGGGMQAIRINRPDTSNGAEFELCTGDTFCPWVIGTPYVNDHSLYVHNANQNTNPIIVNVSNSNVDLNGQLFRTDIAYFTKQLYITTSIIPYYGGGIYAVQTPLDLASDSQDIVFRPANAEQFRITAAGGALKGGTGGPTPIGFNPFAGMAPGSIHINAVTQAGDQRNGAVFAVQSNLTSPIGVQGYAVSGIGGFGGPIALGIGVSGTSENGSADLNGSRGLQGNAIVGGTGNVYKAVAVEAGGVGQAGGGTGNTFIGVGFHFGSFLPGVSNKWAIEVEDPSSIEVFRNLVGPSYLGADSNGVLYIASDARLKLDLGRYDRGLDAIRRLAPHLFRWREASRLAVADLNVGFMAQEVGAVLPEAVNARDAAQACGTVGDAGCLAINDRAIVAAMVNAIQELDRNLAAVVGVLTPGQCAAARDRAPALVCGPR